MNFWSCRCDESWYLHDTLTALDLLMIFHSCLLGLGFNPNTKPRAKMPGIWCLWTWVAGAQLSPGIIISFMHHALGSNQCCAVIWIFHNHQFLEHFIRIKELPIPAIFQRSWRTCGFHERIHNKPANFVASSLFRSFWEPWVISESGLWIFF